jgi:hypothetical protein
MSDFLEVMDVTAEQPLRVDLVLAAAAVDKTGVEYHTYAEKGSFVLNNDCGDCLPVWWKDKDGNWHCHDSATPDGNPPEGVILYRSGTKLIAGSLGTMAERKMTTSLALLGFGGLALLSRVRRADSLPVLHLFAATYARCRRRRKITL